MRLASLLALLAAAASAAAATPAEDALRARIDVLQNQVPQLPLVNSAPELPKQIKGLSDALDALAKEDKSRAAEVEPILSQAASLASTVGGKTKAPTSDFYKNIASSVKALADAAATLLATAPKGTMAARGPQPANRPNELPPVDPKTIAERDQRLLAEASGARTKALGLAGEMSTDLAGTDRPAVAAALPAPADVPLPRSRELSYAPGQRNTQVASLQTALGVSPDGRFGNKTKSAVEAVQRKNGLEPTGVIDRQTEALILQQYQAKKNLPVTGALDAATAQALAPVRRNPRAAPDRDDADKNDSLTGAKIQTDGQGIAGVRTLAEGYGVGDQNYGANHHAGRALEGGGFAVSPNLLAKGFKNGDVVQYTVPYKGRTLTYVGKVQDVSYLRPGAPTTNVVEIYSPRSPSGFLAKDVLTRLGNGTLSAYHGPYDGPFVIDNATGQIHKQ
jgi:peptidoglycan hydrolase-like protein with peptidoglycan-binding domain